VNRMLVLLTGVERETCIYIASINKPTKGLVCFCWRLTKHQLCSYSTWTCSPKLH